MHDYSKYDETNRKADEAGSVPKFSNPERILAEARFIVIEGRDGSGKTTLSDKLRPALEESIARRLAELDANPIPVHAITPWEATEWTKQVRTFFTGGINDARTEMLLAFAARRALLTEKILPILKRGEFVILDRYIASTIAYQCTTRDDFRTVLDLSRDFCEGKIPGLTLYLDVDYGTAHKRAEERGTLDSIESRGESFHASLDVGFRVYFSIMSKASNAFAVRIDANQDESTVFGHALAVVETYLDLLFGLDVANNSALRNLEAWNITSVGE